MAFRVCFISQLCLEKNIKPDGVHCDYVLLGIVTNHHNRLVRK